MLCITEADGIGVKKFINTTSNKTMEGQQAPSEEAN